MSMEWGTFFTFSYFACEVDLTMIVVSHAKTITIRYAGGGASYYVGGRRFKVCRFYDYILQQNSAARSLHFHILRATWKTFYDFP
jgi:hypothetical protein